MGGAYHVVVSVLFYRGELDSTVMNTGSRALKLFTVYSPPNHIDGRVHATRAEADVDVEDEGFGKNMDVGG